MASLVRRPSSLAFLVGSSALVALASAAVACGSSDDTPGSEPINGDAGIVERDSGTRGDADADAGTDAASNDVVVRLNARYGFSDNALTEDTGVDGLSATIIATVDGKLTTFLPTKRADGAFVFAGVPRAPYVLETRRRYDGMPASDPSQVSRYPIDGAREVRLGGDFWKRQDTTAMTDATKLALSVQVPAAVENNDQFSWVGVHSYFYRVGKFSSDSTGMTNVPAAGATSTSNWTFATEALQTPYSTEASGLPVASAKDDLVVFQTRVTPLTTPANPSDSLDRFNPWKTISNESTIGVLDVQSPDFENDTTNTVTGTLAAPSMAHLTVDFHGTTYAALRQAANYSKDTSSRAQIMMVQEAGAAGQQVFSSVAPTSWSLSVSSKKKPVDLTCFPDGATTCVTASCVVGCPNATDGYLDPGDLSQFEFDAPRIFPNGMRDIYAVSYTFSRSLTLDDGKVRALSASVSESLPKTTDAPSFSLQIDPVTDLRVAGQTLDVEVVSPVSDAEPPLVTFTAPVKGAPEYYRIELFDLTPDLGSTSSSRTSLQVAWLYTREPSVTLPKEEMRSGHVYYLRVSAVKDGWDFTGRPQNDGRAFRTGIFSGAFRFGTKS